MISAKVLEMVFCNDALILWIRACNSIQSSNIGARWNYIMIVVLGGVYMGDFHPGASSLRLSLMALYSFT